MRFKRRLKIEEGRLDLIPLIDVVFLLLIFFMLSSSFIFQPGIRVKLPESSISETKKEKSYEVILTQENLMFFNGERISVEGLKRKMKIIGKTAPEAVLIIRADESARHKYVVRVMSIAKMNGIKKLAIATTPVEGSNEE
ncbi:MAG: biopolymer transporter ExbD [Candidatus Pacebacteria bacterium]|nr:biopolymer transporter ExbD [Candidatus Paceibacterota bacterium]